MTVKFNCYFCGAEHEFEVELSRPPASCSNPNSPAFSDDGDAGGITDGPTECSCGTRLDTKVIQDAIQEKAEKEAMEI